jgi:hypothetical protein
LPFNPATGVYTPPTGAENAAPGEVIRSATWNTIFTDIAAALTQLGQSSWVVTPRVITTAGSFTVHTTDSIIQVKASAPTIFLQPVSLMTAPVKIMGATASVFGNFTSVVVPVPPDTISGQGTLLLNANFQVATFFPVYDAAASAYALRYVVAYA